MKILLRLLLASMALLAVSCDTMQSFRKPKYTVTVHVQGSSTDHPREIITVPLAGQQLIFKKIPEFGTRAIAAFQSFPAENGMGNGVLLRLDAHGRNQLETASRLSQGSLMLSMVNGVPVDVIQLDRPITDGMFTIWQGVADETIVQMGKKLPHVAAKSNSSPLMDMTPSTSKEKREARRAEQEMKKEQEALERRIKRGEDVSKPPRTKEIPLE